MRKFKLQPPAGLIAGLALFALVLVAMSCSKANSPTNPATTDLALSDVILTVDGQVMNGATVHQGHGEGMSTRFQATLWRDAERARGETVRMRYERPGGMGMMGSTGVLTLYDDGTHGDHTPGDGIYCFEDWQERYGCHGTDAPMGNYHYEFWGEDHMGHESNHVMVNVTVVP